MADLPADGYDEETGPDERPARLLFSPSTQTTSETSCSPAEAIIQLEHDDPRAIDFRSTLRTSVISFSTFYASSTLKLGL